MPYPTCAHRKDDGALCGSPALRRHKLCYFHHRDQQRQLHIAQALRRANICDWELPALESPEDVHQALERIWYELLADRLDYQRAGQMLYTLQEMSRFSATLLLREKPKRKSF
jgi:hypothetical protein